MLRNTLLFAVGVATPFVLSSFLCGSSGSKSVEPVSSCCATSDAFAAAEFTVPAEPISATTASAPVAASAVKGVVKFEGAAPARKAIDMAADGVCAGLHTDRVLDEDVVVSKEGMLRDVFVYVKKGADGKYDTPSEPVVLDQKGCVYVPHVLGVMPKQMIRILNSDGTTHNVHASPRKNAAFNQGQPAGADALEKEMKNAETSIPVKCDIHPWMHAVIHVVKNPHFAVSAENGSFEIKGLPAGEYTLEAIHDTLGKQTADVRIGDGETKEISFSFKAK